MTEIREGKMPRQTKIIITLGPATDDPAVVEGLVHAGIDAARINFSHGDAAEHLARANLIRKISGQSKYHLGIIGDLQGPKVRIARFTEGQVQLKADQQFILDANMDQNAGSAEAVGLTYPDLYKDISSGDILLVDDGRVELLVVSSDSGRIVTRVQHDSVLSSNKGLNRSGGGLSAPALTQKDHKDISLAARMRIDYLAVSFAKSADDILRTRKLLNEADCSAGIIAKIERAEALEAIDEIIEASDGIMIARGDLNLEIGDAALIAVQKRLINRARSKQKIVITATEMMQSMIESPRPTRAEISDVANAVLDGTDAVMLSGETAIGKYPIVAVETMSRICCGAEQSAHYRSEEEQNIGESPVRIDQAIAIAAIRTGRDLRATAIAALTESGSSALWMSRMNPSIPIYALTRHVATCRKVTLYRGVYPGDLNTAHSRHEEVNREVINVLLRCRAVESGDLVIITKGDLMGVHGGTNAMKVLRVNLQNDMA